MYPLTRVIGAYHHFIYFRNTISRVPQSTYLKAVCTQDSPPTPNTDTTLCMVLKVGSMGARDEGLEPRNDRRGLITICEWGRAIMNSHLWTVTYDTTAKMEGRNQ